MHVLLHISRHLIGIFQQYSVTHSKSFHGNVFTRLINYEFAGHRISFATTVLCGTMVSSRPARSQILFFYSF